MNARKKLEDLKGRIERCQDKGDGMNWIAVFPKNSAAISEVLTQEGALRVQTEEAIELLTAAYDSGHRDGWESGPSTNETMESIFDWLCDHDADPTTGKTQREEDS